MYKLVVFPILIFVSISCNPKLSSGLRKNDLKKDVEMKTSHGIMIIRLSDSTPLHRDNFLKLVKQGFYDSISFHRVIQNFMIQAGDPFTKSNRRSQATAGITNNSIVAEFRNSLFHKKGAVAAARLGDNVNPQKASSNTQFYIVQGKRFTDAGLDSVEIFRMDGKKISESHRSVYKNIGGTPHLDMSYTVFGEVIQGLDVIDKIAAESTSGNETGNRPLKDIRIIKATLVKRKN